MRWLAAPTKQTRVLVTGRRWGKSEAVAIETLYKAVFRPGTRRCIVSVTMDQARLSWDVAVAQCSRQPLLEALVDKIRVTPFPTIKFKHGSELMVRTAAREGIYLRGHKFHQVVADEADYLSERFINEAVRMTLADYGGELTLISTPRARRGLVYGLLQRGLGGDPGIYAQQGPTWENPNVSHTYIEGLRDQMTSAAWQREVEGIYADDDETVFRWADIQAAYLESDWILPDYPEDQDLRRSRRYVAGWDLAKSQDWTVGIVLDATAVPYRLVSFERFQRQPWPAVGARIRETHKKWGCHQTLVDSTGIGAAVLDEVADIAQGYLFTGRAKTDLLTNAQLVLEKHEVKFPFVRELVDELQAYAWEDEALVTDCVMSLAMACWAAGPRSVMQTAPAIYV